ERSVDDAGFDHAGLRAESDHCEVHRGEVAEGAEASDARLEITDLGNRKRHILRADARRCLPDVNQTIFVAVYKRAEQHTTDNAEDGGSGANAERQREHDSNGQALGTKQRAYGITNVQPKCLEARLPTHIPHLFLYYIDAADLETSGAGRFLSAQPPQGVS